MKDKENFIKELVERVSGILGKVPLSGQPLSIKIMIKAKMYWRSQIQAAVAAVLSISILIMKISAKTWG